MTTSTEVDALLAHVDAYATELGTHWEGCEANHPRCLLHKLAQIVREQRDAIDELKHRILWYEAGQNVAHIVAKEAINTAYDPIPREHPYWHTHDCSVHSPTLRPCSCGLETRLRTIAERAESALAQAQARIAELYELLGESGMELARCKIFVGSREKMHPDGLTLYQELLDRIDAAMEKEKKIGVEK